MTSTHFGLKKYCNNVDIKHLPFLAHHTLQLHSDDRLFHGSGNLFDAPYLPRNTENRFSTNRKLSVQRASTKTHSCDNSGYLYTYRWKKGVKEIPHTIITCSTRLTDLKAFLDDNTTLVSKDLDSAMLTACNGEWNAIYAPRWEQQLVLCGKNSASFIEIEKIEKIFDVNGEKVFKDLGIPPVDYQIPCTVQRCTVKMKQTINEKPQTTLSLHTGVAFQGGGTLPLDETWRNLHAADEDFSVTHVDYEHRIVEFKVVRENVEKRVLEDLIRNIQEARHVVCVLKSVRLLPDGTLQLNMRPDQLDWHVKSMPQMYSFFDASPVGVFDSTSNPSIKFPVEVPSQGHQGLVYPDKELFQNPFQMNWH